MTARARATTVLAVLCCLLVAACQGTVSKPSAGPKTTPSERTVAAPPAVTHVFVVNLENQSYDKTFASDSDAPYLARTLTLRGALLEQYFGIAHYSLPNYLAQITGQGPNRATQADCGVFSRFELTGWQKPQQAVGEGCVYPARVTTIANQLEGKGLTWHGYMEDMGSPCRRPVLGQKDESHDAKPGDQYATRHNPFVYFDAISPASCRRNVVDLDRLQPDLASAASTPNLSYITPNLCNDGHDTPCVDGAPGGLTSANAWLETWMPRIMASPAYTSGGMLVVTFDEAETNQPGAADACCGQGSSPNSEQAGIKGPGGGRIGAVVLSPFVRPGTRSDTPYNQYSLLRTLEDVFGLPRLGYASTASPFGDDVWTDRGRG